MIRLTDTFTEEICDVQSLKIACTRAAYPDISQLWVQHGGTFISCLEGDAVISGDVSDAREMREFLMFLSPRSVFLSLTAAKKLFDCTVETVGVYCREGEALFADRGEQADSRMLYDALCVPGLQLPEYEYFAVDFCHRLNRGQAEYYYKKDRCAAIAFVCGGQCLINGVASRAAGGGRQAVEGVTAKCGAKRTYAVCRSENRGFYEKLGFKYQYEAAYYRRTDTNELF